MFTDTLIVSPIPSANKVPSPTDDLIKPPRIVPASVTPRCKGYGIFSAIERYASIVVNTSEDFRETFHIATSNQFTGEVEKLANYLASTLMYMKPISGLVVDDEGEANVYTYQDECEWRYIPSDSFPTGLPLILKQSETTITARETYSKVLKKHPECWLKFEWDEVRYIIVPDDAAARNTIAVIKELNMEDVEKDMLISKIEISRRFSDNM